MPSGDVVRCCGRPSPSSPDHPHRNSPAAHLQRARVREGHVPRVGALVHGVQVQGGLQLGLAACTDGGGWSRAVSTWQGSLALLCAAAAGCGLALTEPNARGAGGQHADVQAGARLKLCVSPAQPSPGPPTRQEHDAGDGGGHAAAQHPQGVGSDLRWGSGGGGGGGRRVSGRLPPHAGTHQAPGRTTTEPLNILPPPKRPPEMPVK